MTAILDILQYNELFFMKFSSYLHEFAIFILPWAVLQGNPWRGVSYFVTIEQNRKFVRGGTGGGLDPF